MMNSFGARPGTAYDATWWAAVHALYEEAFPGLPSGIERAREAGFEWGSISTPFALFEGERCVSHVGVITHPMWLGGERVEIAGIHAVCTARDRRRRGLCRRTLGAALEWADERHVLAKLHTDAPGVYTGHGFVAAPTWRFRASVSERLPAEARVLEPSRDAEDRSLLARLLRERTPVSLRCATADPGWVVSIDAALGGLLDTGFRYLPEHDAIVCLQESAGQQLVVEVIAPELPPAAVVLGQADSARPLYWSFPPDRFDLDAVPEPAPSEIGVFMTRGPWPEVGPVGISPLWEH